MPDKVLGDIQAQLSALRQGERDVLRLVEEHGLENLKSYMTDIIDYTERLTRAEIEGLPDGSWEFTDYVDDDGFSPKPIAIKVRVTIEGDEIELDFTGTSPQAKGSINPNLAFTKSAVYAVLKCITNPNIMANAGFVRPIKVVAEPGSYVNPQHPAPVAARGLGGFRVAHTVLGAMAKALPDRIPGAWGGGEIGVTFGGYHPGGKAFVFLEFNNDGPRGGGPFADGADGATAPVTNQANTPIGEHRGGPAAADQPLRLCPRQRRRGRVPGRSRRRQRVRADGGRGDHPDQVRPRQVPPLGSPGRRFWYADARHPEPRHRQRGSAFQVHGGPDGRRTRTGRSRPEAAVTAIPSTATRRPYSATSGWRR